MYYLYNSHIYKYLPSQRRYLLCTSIKKFSIRRNKFDLAQAKQISREDANKLINEYFNALAHKWEYKGEKYEKGKIPISELGKDISNMRWHNNEACIWYEYKIILVWWRGRVYYALPDMRGCYFKINLYEVGKEIDFNTRIYASDKNIFPVYKIEGDTLKSC